VNRRHRGTEGGRREGTIRERGEAWAIAQGLPAIELDTGAPNRHARRFYAHLGYSEESVKLVKQLPPS